MARTQSRVFDGAAHARALEKAFTEMLRRHDDRLPPAPFATDEL
jgi:hypothetical protein